MFATVDCHGTRFLRCKLVTDQGTFPAKIDTVSEYQNLKARVVPTERELRVLAGQLATARWYLPKCAIPDGHNSAQLESSRLLVATPFDSSDSAQQFSKPLRLIAIKLELRGVRVDRRNRELQSFKMAEITHKVPVAPDVIAMIGSKRHE